MAYAPAAPDSERLPWLNDERTKARPSDLRTLILWSVVAMLLIAGASFWIGKMAQTTEPASADALSGVPSTATIPLPAPLPAEPFRHEVAPVAMPEVKPVASPPEVSIARPKPVRSQAERSSRRTKAKSARTSAKRSPRSATAAKRSSATRLWPADQSAGASGRVVRIGTFTNRLQAKRGWSKLVRAYPGMKRLKAVVVGNPSLRNGRTYYRLQFGTSSQAHSAVLCQWMRTIGQSCVVVGLQGGVA